MMDYYQLLNDYVDGVQLEYSRELALFSELRVNDRLRGELQTAILLLRAAGLDISRYSPPKASTEQIFGVLGFTHPPGQHGIMDAPRGNTGRSRMPSFASGTFAGFVAGLIVAFVFLYRTGAEATEPPRTALTGAASAAGGTALPQPDMERYEEPASIPAIPAVVRRREAEEFPEPMHGARMYVQRRYVLKTDPGARSMDGHRLNTRRTAPPLYNNARRDNTEPNAYPRDATDEHPALHSEKMPEEEGSLTALPRIPEVVPRMLPPAPRTYPTTVASRALEEQIPIPQPEHAGVSPAWEQTLPISAEVRAVASRDFEVIPPTLRGDNGQLLKNCAVGLYYHLNTDEWLGLEMGQEAYYQEFTSHQSGVLVRYQQAPMILWGGLSYKRIVETPSGLRPYAQATAGFSQFGPAGRAAIGTYYRLVPALSLFAAFEISATGYQAGPTWYLSPKYGFSYGCLLTY